MRALLDKIPLTTAVIIALTLGLAPFLPQPHVLEKLGMLASGTRGKPVDMIDLLMHGLPWVLLALKLALPAKTS